jgi:hypothetical protein
MNLQDSGTTYHVWAADNLIYGPVDFPTLIQWVREGRILAATWVFSAFDGDWHEAGTISELHEFLAAAENIVPQESPADESASIAPGELRQFSIFAGLTDEQLNQFLTFGEQCRVPAREWFIKKGDPGDALFFVIEGSVRVRLRIGRDDRTLSVIPAGQFFGEMAMFNRAPRSADVVAESDTRLFRLSAESFLAMTRENPALAAPILFALAGAMATRVSEANQQLQREVVSGFAWS